MHSKLPYVLLKSAMSLDGFIDRPTGERLILSSPEDSEAVDELRASVDAILVGANTVRRDNPRLLVRSEQRREQRRQTGSTPSPMKVVISQSGDLDPTCSFFTMGDVLKLVYCPAAMHSAFSSRFGAVAEVVAAGEQGVDLPLVLSDLSSRGIGRLLVEGGSRISTQFLEQGLVDELRVAIAPFFVGDDNAPRFVNVGHFFHDSDQRMNLIAAEQNGDTVALRYRLDRNDSVKK